MAKLIKGGARKERIANGVAYTGNIYSEGMNYDLTVADTLTHAGPSYTARLTEAEMLHTIQEWLIRFNAHQAQKRKDAVRAA